MKTYSADELEIFLRALDAALARKATLLIIGGSAASLAYGFQRATSDVDTLTALTEDIAHAATAARDATGLNIPIGPATVAEFPEHFEDRLVQVPLNDLVKLTVLVPERHDLVLSKLVRAYEHDLEAAESIHQTHPLDFEVLVTRYIDEFFFAIGSRQDLDSRFLAGVERCFPDRVDEAAQRLAQAKRRRGW